MFVRCFLFVALTVLGLLGTSLVASAPPPGTAVERAWDAQGRVVWERGLVAGVHGLAYEKHIRWDDGAAKPDKPDKPGKPGGGPGGGSGGGGGLPGNDCAATQYKLTGYHWTTPYAGYTTGYTAAMNAAGQTWDDATGTDLFGGFQAGSLGTAGELDGVNQIDFVNLGGGGTIAVTTTWYYTSTGQAVESDGQYNTHYSWSTTGAAEAMDVENIAAHEIGHTWGLDHPNGPGHKIGCLTMYAYGVEGETKKRTLGSGDILGLRELYGA